MVSRASTRSSVTRRPRAIRSPLAPRRAREIASRFPWGNRRFPRGRAGPGPLPAQTGGAPLAGLRAVVTGASSGIGRAIAAAFAASGARVGIGFSRSSKAAQELAGELGTRHPLLRADLSTLDG